MSATHSVSYQRNSLWCIETLDERAVRHHPGRAQPADVAIAVLRVGRAVDVRDEVDVLGGVPFHRLGRLKSVHRRCLHGRSTTRALALIALSTGLARAYQSDHRP